MSDFYEEQISDLEDHVGGLEIDLKEANQEIERLREALADVIAQASRQPKSCGHEFYCTCPFDKAEQVLKEK